MSSLIFIGERFSNPDVFTSVFFSKDEISSLSKEGKTLFGKHFLREILSVYSEKSNVVESEEYDQSSSSPSGKKSVVESNNRIKQLFSRFENLEIFFDREDDSVYLGYNYATLFVQSSSVSLSQEEISELFQNTTKAISTITSRPVNTRLHFLVVN